MSVLKQTPLPGRHLLFYCGDLVEFRLESDQPIEGDVFLRTNLGNAAYHRKEIIEHVESGINPGFQDWCNLPMKRIDEFTFTIRLMLTEEGHFEGKCFVRQKDEEPVWAEGENVHLNDCKGCIVHAPGTESVVLQGLEDSIVVERDGRLLVCRLSEEQRIKDFRK